MKRILLASVAVAALSFPAIAQNNGQMQQPKQNDQTNQSQMQNGGRSGNPQEQTQGSQAQESNPNEQQATERINPRELNRDQVKQIQQALDKNGFNTKKVDGIWGPETAAALREFQQKKNIEAKGHLTQQTLAELGVNWSGQNQPQTTGSGQNSNQEGSSGQMNKSNTSGSGSSTNANETKAKPSTQNGGSSSQSGTNGMGQNGSNHKPMNNEKSGSSGQSKQY